MRSLVAALSLYFAAHALAQTAFTYQGELRLLGSPVTGTYDMRFRLYDAATGTTQVGTTQCINDVTVTEGKFTTQVDFGAQFNGTAPRFVEIDVRSDTGQSCLDVAGYSTLAPRQPLTVTPRASAAAVANSLVRPNGTGTGVVNVTNAGDVGINTTTPAGRLDVASGGGSYFRVDAPNGDIRVNGGTDGFFGFFNEGVAAGRTEFISNAGVNISISNATGNVGVGTTAPASKLDVRGDVRLGSAGQFFAVKSPANDRTIRGVVLGNGTIDATRSTTGFTISNTVTGTYVINFSPAFTSPPVIVATPNAACCKVHITQTQTTFATILVRDAGDNTTATAAPFHFIVMGQ